jgi:fluoroacetyl-CoA thioesterase
MARSVPIGTRAEAEIVIEFKHTLSSYNSKLPPVLSTPHMIGFMEHVCLIAQEPYCEEGEITVGTAIHVDHRAPTTIGQRIFVDATLESVDGRFFIYRVSARNEQQQIGSGTVHRTVVNLENFRKKFSPDGVRAKGSPQL